MPRPTIRVALPGYRVDTDTDPDHFALFGDEDWVLIKEKERGSVTVANGSSQTITHGLGYVPMVFVYGQLQNDEWTQIFGDSTELSAYIDVTATTLVIHNSYAQSKQFKYYIFYDRIVAPGLMQKSMRYLVSGEDPGAHPVLAVAREGVDAINSLNPNDYIYHSDYNTFKVISSGLYEPLVTHDAGILEFRVAHGKEYRPFVLAFMKEESINEVTTPGNISGSAGSYLEFVSCSADYTDIIFRIVNRSLTTDLTAHIRYYILEVPL